MYKTLSFDQLASTHTKAVELASTGQTEICLLYCKHQLAGRGQRNNTWESEAYKNITCSWILQPTFLPPDQLFTLSKVFSLAVCKQLRLETGLDVRIKWPNDIYIANKKIAGILTEHAFKANALSYTIISLGLNVNQIEFLSQAPNPSSLALECGKNFDLDQLRNSLAQNFVDQYQLMPQQDGASFNQPYFDLLFRNTGYHYYKTPTGHPFEARIKEVCQQGELILEDRHQQIHQFAFKEVQFVL